MVEDRHYYKYVFWFPESSFWVHFVETHSDYPAPKLQRKYDEELRTGFAVFMSLSSF